jgi:tetratricopeptide (TPR) repeat protein
VFSDGVKGFIKPKWFIVSFLVVAIGIIELLLINRYPQNELLQNFWILRIADWISLAIIVPILIIIAIWISFRGVLREIRQLCWETFPPVLIIWIQEFWSFWHRLAQLIAYQCGGRFIYVLLFIIAVGLFTLGQGILVPLTTTVTTNVSATYDFTNNTVQLPLTQSQNGSTIATLVSSTVNTTYNFNNTTAQFLVTQSQNGSTIATLVSSDANTTSNVTNITAQFLVTQSQSGNAIASLVTSVLSFDGLLKILLFYSLLLIVYWIWKYRSVLVIEDFDDFISALNEYQGKGIAQLLLVELDRINQLYSDVYEQRPIATSVGEARQISAVLKVDDPGTGLSQAVAASSTVSIGSITFPLGLFVSLFNTLGRGPRIRGSIRKGEGDSLLLLASSSGFHYDFGWKVSSIITAENRRLLFPEEGDKECPAKAEDDTPKSGKDTIEKIPKILLIQTDLKTYKTPEPDKTKTPEPDKTGKDSGLSLEKMVHELACMIMTDIPAPGSIKWEATMLFNRGLMKYRECLRTPKDQTSNFKQAEEYFQKALVYDNKFTTAWYNLGVVYSELGMKIAAEKAFARVIELDQNKPEAYYGRALTRYMRYHWRLIDTEDGTGSRPTIEEYKNEVIRYCDQAEALLRHVDRPFERTSYWLHGGIFPEDYLHLLAQCYHLKGMACLDMAELKGFEVAAQEMILKEAVNQVTTPTQKLKEKIIAIATITPKLERAVTNDITTPTPKFEKVIDALTTLKLEFKRVVKDSTSLTPELTNAVNVVSTLIPRLKEAENKAVQARQKELIILKEAFLNFNLATAAAWKNYYRSDRYGTDANHYKKRYSEEVCRFLTTCLSDLGWAYITFITPFRTFFSGAKKNWEIWNYPDIPDIAYILCAAIDLNPKLNSDTVCAELHARLGIWNIIRGEYRKAWNEFQTAVQISPHVMKYHMFCIFAGSVLKKYPKYQDLCSNLDLGLEYAIDAYKNQANQRDAQWRSLDELHILLKKPLENELCISEINDKFFQLFDDIRQFCKKCYSLEQLLDFYTVDYTGNSYDRMVESSFLVLTSYYDQKFNGKRPSYVNTLPVKYESIQQWMQGQTCYLEGRWRYYQADYGRWLNEDKQIEKLFLPIPFSLLLWKYGSRLSLIEGYKNVECYNFSGMLFKKSRECFIKSLAYFNDLPKEREKIYPRIALIQTVCCEHDYPNAFYTSAVAHALNPIGNYEHVIQGLQAIDIDDNQQAINFFSEALHRAYDLPDFSQYLMNQYYRKLALAHFKHASESDNEQLRQKHFTQILNTLDEAMQKFRFCYQQCLCDEECDTAKVSMDSCPYGNPWNMLDYSCYPELMPACTYYPEINVQFCNNISLKRHQATEYLHRIMSIHNIKGYYLDIMGCYDEAIREFTIVNSFYQPPYYQSFSGCDECTKPDQGSSQNSDKKTIKWPWFREFLLSLCNLASVYYNKLDYCQTLSYIRQIRSYKQKLGENFDDEPYWVRGWMHASPYEILVLADLWELKINLDAGKDCLNTDMMKKRVKGICENLDKMKKIKYPPFNCDRAIWKDLESTLMQKTAELYVILGRMNLKHLDGCPCLIPNEIMGSADNEPVYLFSRKLGYLDFQSIDRTYSPDINTTAFRCFDKAFRCGADARMYLDILRELSDVISKDPEKKPDLKELKAHAEKYFESFKKLPDAGKYKTFTEEYSKIIEAWKKPKEPEPDKKYLLLSEQLSLLLKSIQEKK